MKVTTSFLLGAALVASGVLAAPQAGQSPTIALINGDRILEGSNIGRQARERLETAAGQWQERINAVQQELEGMTRQRQEQALTLNDTALARLNQDIEERQVTAERMNDDARRELARMEQQVTLDVNAQLGPMVERFATDRGYDLILDTSRTQGMLFFALPLDVTDDFLAMVNAATPGTGAPE